MGRRPEFIRPHLIKLKISKTINGAASVCIVKEDNVYENKKLEL